MSAPKNRPPVTPCIYCGATVKLTIEHLIPLSRGGSNSIHNLAWSCSRCNNAKACLTHDEYMKLRHDPLRLATERKWVHRQVMAATPPRRIRLTPDAHPKIKRKPLKERKQPTLTETVGDVMRRLEVPGWGDL